MYRLRTAPGKHLFAAVVPLILALLLPCALHAQVTKVRGAVLDAESGEPLPFVGVYFEGTTIGISTDLEGRYYIETRDPSAKELRAYLLGYEPEVVAVQPGAFTEVNFHLKLDRDQLAASVVKPDNKRIRRFLKALDEHRTLNDPMEYDQWLSRVYSRMEVDATHLDWLVDSKVGTKVLAPLLACKDTSAITGESFYPVVISETMSDKYHQKNPAVDKEIIQANKISGFETDNALTQFTGMYVLELNLYDATIPLFNATIPSPLAAYGHAFYNYYLVDSLQVDGRKTYCLRFHPKKLVNTPTLDGQLDIDAEDYAVRSASVRLSDNSNVNWVRHLNLELENQRLPSGKWFPREESLFMDLAVSLSDSSKIVSLLATRKLDYGEPDFAGTIPDEIRDNGDPVVYVGMDKPFDWDAERPVPLSQRESNIFIAVDQIQRSRTYGVMYAIGSGIGTGYVALDKGPVGYGPWQNIVRYNPTEGLHLGVGARTTRFFSKKFRITGNIGYGFKDHLFKGAGSVEWMIRRDKTRKLTVAYSYDYKLLAQGKGLMQDNNVFNSLMANRNDRETLISSANLEYEHEFLRSFTGYLTMGNTIVFGNDHVPFMTRTGDVVPAVLTTKVGLGARLSWGERINRGIFEKSSIFTRYPVLNIDVSAGRTEFGSGSQPFLRTELTSNWNIPGNPLGFSSLRINMGKIWGDVPYTQLKLHEGNQGIFRDRTAFSCMNYYEFASDQWLDVFFEHNFMGLFLGKIPLLKELDWREVVSAKMAMGTIRPSNHELSTLEPIAVMNDLAGKPYVEVGVGVTNILRLFKVDFNWRLTYRETRPFCVTIGMDLKF